jgi:serine/threonine protein kinase/tetratricopeptide (TPR) repeat protein
VSRLLHGELPAREAAEGWAHVAQCDSCALIVTRERAANDTPSTVAESADARLPPASASDLPRGASVGRYVILDRLAVGGMGVVYAAWDPELNRKVALKLLRALATDGGAALGHARLLREAQAMARLSHPSVVAVHDVGSFGDRVFVAMELVEGGTLRQWVKAKPRSWREVTEVLVKAGRGLVAAHAAGLVHRDFKPDNILVDEDGRVRVTDFGLARLADPSAPPAPSPVVTPAARPSALAPSPTPASDDSGRSSPPPPPVPGASTSSLESPLTQAGTVMGTPRYMSPEQHRGEPTDPRGDQFSFCVTLWEALYDATPFPGRERIDIAAAIVSGRIADPPDPRGVPRWVDRIARRGMSPEPAQRYPSMEELLAALSADPGARRRRFAAVAVLGLVVVGTVLASREAARRQSLVCKGAEEQLAGVWDAPRRAAMETAFRATRVPFAAGAAKLAGESLDGYAARWARARVDACEATRVRKEQTEEALSLRIECLDQRRSDLAALAGVLATADTAVVGRAAQAVAALDPVEGCANVTALRAPVRPPDARVQGEVARLRERASEVKALSGAGRYAEAVAVARPLADAAKRLGYRPLEGELQLLLGAALQGQTNYPASIPALSDAILAAEAGRDRSTAARAATTLFSAFYAAARYPEGAFWERYAVAALEARGGGDGVEIDLLNGRAMRALEEGHNPEAVELLERALSLAEQLYGAESLAARLPLLNLGVAASMRGDDQKARQLLERTVSLDEKILGMDHPTLATSLQELASVYRAGGDAARAQALLERARAICLAAYGPDAMRTATVEVGLGELLFDGGKTEEAERLHRHAVAAIEKAVGHSNPQTATALHALGIDLAKLGRSDEAIATLRESVAIEEQALGKDNPATADDVATLGSVLLEAGRTREARVQLERALAAHEASPTPADLLGENRFALAQALWPTPPERKRSRRLAEQALADFGTIPGGAARATAVRRWLEAHR